VDSGINKRRSPSKTSEPSKRDRYMPSSPTTARLARKAGLGAFSLDSSVDSENGFVWPRKWQQQTEWRDELKVTLHRASVGYDTTCR